MSIVACPAFNDNYIWLIIDEARLSLTCVDPGDAMPVLSYAKKNGLTLNHILITHHHADHVGGVSKLLHAYPNACVYGPVDPRISGISVGVQNEDVIHIDQSAFRVLNTPGHTSTHICYQEPTKGWLFCGDTLFSGGCGRVFDGTIESLHRSILLLKNLQDDTRVYCGHEYTRQNLQFARTVEPENNTLLSYLFFLEQNPDQCSLPSSIGLEKQINPFMRTDTPSVQKYAHYHGLESNDSLSIFKLLRERKNCFI